MGRYLLSHRRVAAVFRWQQKVDRLDCYSDADWGGDPITRRSVSGGCILRGSHCLKTWCKKQQVVALSSAESELYAGLRTASEGLGMQALGSDMGQQYSVMLHLDSTAALSLVNKVGLGRAKHIEMQHLWLQHATNSKRVSTAKVGTEENPAYLMTKGLHEDRVNKLLNIMGHERHNDKVQEEARSGRS